MSRIVAMHAGYYAREHGMGEVFERKVAEGLTEFLPISSTGHMILASAAMGIHDDEFVKTYCSMLVERVTFLNDFWEQGRYFFEPPHELDEKTIQKKWKEGKKESFPTLIDMIADLTDFTAANIEATVKQYMADHSLGFGDVLPMIRIMLTGTMQGPPIFETAVLLGKHETVQRMRNSIEKFDHITAN